MRAMHSLQSSLRQAHHIARFMLVWFVLSLAVAIAAPLVHPQGMQLVCTASGSIKAIAIGEEVQGNSASHHTLDCPLCAVLGAPPPLDKVFFSAVAPQNLALALRDTGSAPAQTSAAPPPARGPPAQA